MNFNNLSGLWFLLFIPLVVLFYLYKNKSKNKVVPSLFIWNKLLESKNKKKRALNKLLKNLLLFLQILAIAGFAFFIAEPYLSAESNNEDIILIVDCSISMMADNSDRSGSLLDDAKMQINEFLKGISDSSVVSVIKAGITSEILSNRSEKAEAIRLIKGLNAEYSSADLNESYSLAEKIADENTKIYIFSTDAVKSEDSRINNFIVGEIEENTALISVFNDIENKTVKVQLKNYTDKNINRTIMLYGEEELLDYKQVELPPNGIESINFENVSDNFLYYKAQTKEAEQLKADDIRYSVSHNGKDKKILFVGDENFYINKAISASFKGEIYKKQNYDSLNSQDYDMYIFNGNVPAVIPEKGNIVIFNPVNSSDLFNVEGYIEGGKLRYNNIKNFEYLDNIDFQLLRSCMIKSENTVLKSAVLNDENPLILVGERNNQKIIVFAFDLYDSDLPLKVDFPIMIKNLIKDLCNNSITEDKEIMAGDNVRLNVYENFTVIKPNGEKIAAENDSDFNIQAEDIGIYTVLHNNKDYCFAVNSYLENEPFEDVDLIEKNDIDKVKINQSLKFLFGAIIIILILTEWLVVNNDN